METSCTGYFIQIKICQGVLNSCNVECGGLREWVLGAGSTLIKIFNKNPKYITNFSNISRLPKSDLLAWDKATVCVAAIIGVMV